jgi:hypothetical protein
MATSDKAIRTFSRRLTGLLILKQGLVLATIWCFLWGTAVLVLRASAGVQRLPLVWGAAGLLVCLAAAVVRARRHRPALDAVRALLDEHGRCGGLLMAGGEQDLGGWQETVSRLTLPRIQWEGQRAWSLLAVAAGFVLLCFLVPDGLADLGGSPPLEVGRDADRLQHLLEVLTDEAILDPGRAELLTQKLNDIRRQASGKHPARALEALDHLHNLAAKTAREAVEKDARQTEQLNRAEMLAEVLSKSSDLFSPHLKLETLTELAAMVDKAGLDVKQIAAHLDPELLKGLQGKVPSPEQLQKLVGALELTKADLLKQAEKLQKAGLIDADLLKRCQEAGTCDCAGLEAFLKEHKGRLSLADVKSACKKGGRGGLTRGPGAAELTFGEASPNERIQFKEQLLPPGQLASLKSSKINAPRGGAAQVVIHDGPGGPATSGALRGTAAGSGSANTEVVLPRHRAAVERYFDRPARETK